jgi:glycosyltransferase involved in cell wall biosynthesis
MDRPDFTVVITCYFEEKSVDEFYTRLRKTLEGMGRSFEIVMVNDGSTDGTWERLKAFHARDPHLTVVDLFRNFGQVNAMTAGAERGSGRSFVFMDSDLQLDPEELPLLVAELDKGADVVSGARRDRKDPLYRRFFSRFANYVMQRMAQAPFTDFGCTFKIFRGELVRGYQLGPFRPYSLLIMRGASRFKEIPITHHPRRYGRSGWTFSKLFRYNFENMLALEGNFQTLSLVAFAIGVLTLLRIALAWVIPGSILAAQPTSGLLLNALLLATTAQLMVLAIVGEYVIRLYGRDRRGPAYIVREVLPSRTPAEKVPA